MLTSYRLGFLTTVIKDLNKINKNNSIFRVGGSTTQSSNTQSTQLESTTGYL